MKDLARRTASSTLLYGLWIMSAALTVKNILGSDNFEDLTDRVRFSFNNLMDFMPISKEKAGALTLVLLSWILMAACGKLLKISVRQSQYQVINKILPEAGKSSGLSLPFGITITIAVVGSLAATIMLFSSYGLFEGIYSRVGSFSSRWADKIPDNDLGRVIYQVLGVLGVGLALMFYMLRAKFKHGPIIRRIEIDGYAWLTEKLAWKNWVIGRKVKFIPGIGKAGVHLPDWASNTDPDERINASIIAKDFVNGKNQQKNYISYFADKEPIDELGDNKKFIRNLMIADGKSKTLVRRARLEEDERRTEAKSQRAFGADCADYGQCLFCCRFSIKRGGLDDGDDSANDEDYGDSGMAANSFEQWDKMGLRKMLDWGDGYKMIYRSCAFDIDMDYFACYFVWKNKAIRRIFYVRDADNIIVAKIREYKVLRKVWPILDNDWCIDIYDPELAKDESFGYVLTLATQLFRKIHIYKENACIKTIEKQDTAKISEGDDK